MSQLVMSKKLFLVVKMFQRAVTFFWIVNLFLRSFSAMLRYSFPLILSHHKGFLRFQISHRQLLSAKGTWLARWTGTGHTTLWIINISVYILLVFLCCADSDEESRSPIVTLLTPGTGNQKEGHEMWVNKDCSKIYIYSYIYIYI